MPDLETIKNEVFALLKGEAADLWDAEEDTDFLKEVGGDLAALRFEKLTVSSETDKKALAAEIKIVEETIRQKLQQKANRLNQKGQELLPRIIGIVLKTLVTVL